MSDARPSHLKPSRVLLGTARQEPRPPDFNGLVGDTEQLSRVMQFVIRCHLELYDARPKPSLSELLGRRTGGLTSTTRKGLTHDRAKYRLMLTALDLPQGLFVLLKT